MFAGLAVSVWMANAQVAPGALGYYNDALNFAQSNPLSGSTARMQGIGGTQISLGADMSSAGSNPAGLGMLNRSVFSFTPSMEFNNSKSNYLGNSLSTYKNNFNFANLGIVFNSNKGDYTNEKFKGGSFAFTLQRNMSFNNESTYKGQNTQNSIIDSFINSAGTSDPANLGGYTNGAYQTYLINPVYNNGNLQGYDSFVLGYPTQKETITTSGSQYAMNFAWGGNYDDKIYFGAGIGFLTMNYDISRIYNENQFTYTDSLGNQQVDDWINYTKINDDLKINGNGVNANFGLIVRPVNFITFGIAYQSPSYYSLSDKSEYTMTTSWNGVTVQDGNNSKVLNVEDFPSDISTSKYNLKTPGKLSMGGTVFIDKYGFISADVILINYSTGQLKSNDFDVTADNQTVSSLYTNVINYRIGAEARLDHFRLRTGFNYRPSPYFDNQSFNASTSSISFGAGYRAQDFFVDLALVSRKSYNAYTPYYISNNQPVANITNNRAVFSATVGFNF